MKKVVSLITILSFVAVVSTPPPVAYAASGITLSAPSALLYDIQARNYLYSKGRQLKRPPASTVKVLTAMVVLDEFGVHDVVRVPSAVENVQPSKINLRGGERYYVRDLIRATLIKSANDAAEALAIAVGGSAYGFSKKMNVKARALGCKNSNFVKANGLPASNQYSTAEDLALIMRAAEKYSFIVETLKIKDVTIRSLSGRSIYFKSHNKMLWKTEKKVIGKTGWTRAARYCFVGSMHLGGNRTVVVSMLGSHSLWRDLGKLVDYLFGKSLTRIKQNRELWGKTETKKIQTALQRAGFSPGPIDGIFGAKTLQAVKAFQRSQGLAVDGIVGSMTWKKLKRYL